MSDAVGTCDVAVLGAGPAGCAAATLLATWGWRVSLLERGDAGRHELGESLPPSCMPVLDAVGIREHVESAGFIRSTGNTAWWGDDRMRVEPFAGGRIGLQVERRALDVVLRRIAVARGARLLLPATVLGVTRRTGEAHDVVVEEDGAERRVSATWVLDCTGRSTLLGRAGREAATSTDGAVRTLALAGTWATTAPWPVPDDSHTLVESAEHGWGWSIPLTATRRYFTVMLDPERSASAAGNVVDRYRAEMGRLPHLAAIAAHGRFEGHAWAIDATPYRVEPVTGERLLLVGDAACSIDPLSSFGVKKALTSGWLAAIAVNTALRTPSMTSDALHFFAERERSYAAGATRELAALAREAERPTGGAFWRARASLGDASAEDGPGEAIASARIAQAFESLKQSARLRLELSPEVSVLERPLVRGTSISLEPHLRVPDVALPMRFARNVDLIALVRLATSRDDVGAMYDAYRQATGDVPLPDFLWALSFLVASGVLRLS